MATTEPLNRLKESGADLLKTLGDEALGTVRDKMSDVTDKLEGVANGNPIGQAALRATSAKAEGKSPAGGAVKGLFTGLKEKLSGGGGGGADKATKAMNIVESIDVGVPIRVAYNQWTQFGEFPSFMKKVESVETAEDNKLNWKAQVFWSHRSWEATIQKQVPDECIVWRSKGQKGHVDGAVTFHELGPNLTRILLILEYYPQGFFERTGNIWRAAGRRARLEFKHFRRHVMTRTILNPDEVEGWRGRIEDGEVVQTHEDALAEEQQAQAEGAEGDEAAEYEEEGAEPAEGDEAAEYEEEGAEPAEGDEAAEYEEEGADEYEGGEEPADEEQDTVAEDEESSAEVEAPEGDEQADEDVEEAAEETPPEEPSRPPSRRRRRPA
ncbi:MAG TPA: SRPBCC family protein [Propionibacteriaceae bacterium]|nr:SRPBCC family protein [Propionibacteriaceae bacterium]